MLFLTLMLACGPYTVQDWWIDQADGFCSCSFPERYDTCVSEQLAGYESSEFWEACHDDVAPVDESAVRIWYRDYTENCAYPSLAEPTPEDPDWFEQCEN